jgi:HTH-type transcriptional regulator/antitoxin HigA
MAMTAYKPYKNFAPSDYIRDELDVRGWLQKDLADVLGVAPKTISAVMRNKQSITADMALLLSKAFGESAEYWMNLEAAYRTRLTSAGQSNTDVERRALIYQYMPVSELRHRGWLRQSSSMSDLVKDADAFWAPSGFQPQLLDAAAAPLFRKSTRSTTYRKAFALTWIRMARICAAKVTVGAYDRDAVESLAKNLPAVTVHLDGVSEFVRLLAGAGVKFVLLAPLRETHLDGACFMDGANPVVAYTGRYGTVDHFWFTMAHELTHILDHLDASEPVLLDLEEPTSGIEERADSGALASLRIPDILARFAKSERYVRRHDVLQCARTLNVSPAVVVGVLQHSRKLPYRSLVDLKPSVLPLIPASANLEASIAPFGEQRGCTCR